MKWRCFEPKASEDGGRSWEEAYSGEDGTSMALRMESYICKSGDGFWLRRKMVVWFSDRFGLWWSPSRSESSKTSAAERDDDLEVIHVRWWLQDGQGRFYDMSPIQSQIRELLWATLFNQENQGRPGQESQGDKEGQDVRPTGTYIEVIRKEAVRSRFAIFNADNIIWALIAG